MAEASKPEKIRTLCSLENAWRNAKRKDNRSRVMREYYARFCENLELKYSTLLVEFPA